MKQSNKVELTPKARWALDIEAARKRMSLKDLASEIILGAISKETLIFISDKETEILKEQISEGIQEQIVKHMSETDAEKRKVREKTTAPSGGKALEKHARALIEHLTENPKTTYTTNDLISKMGLNKSTTIQIMKRAVELDPEHIKLETGERKRLYLTYEP